MCVIYSNKVMIEFYFLLPSTQFRVNGWYVAHSRGLPNNLISVEYMYNVYVRPVPEDSRLGRCVCIA